MSSKLLKNLFKSTFGHSATNNLKIVESKKNNTQTGTKNDSLLKVKRSAKQKKQLERQEGQGMTLRKNTSYLNQFFL